MATMIQQYLQTLIGAASTGYTRAGLAGLQAVQSPEKHMIGGADVATVAQRPAYQYRRQGQLYLHAVRVMFAGQARQIESTAGGGHQLGGILVFSEGKGIFHPEQPLIILLGQGKTGKHPAVAWAEKFHGVLLVLMQMIIVIIK